VPVTALLVAILLSFYLVIFWLFGAVLHDGQRDGRRIRHRRRRSDVLKSHACKDRALRRGGS